MKAIVTKDFTDRITFEKHKVGNTIERTEERIDELLGKQVVTIRPMTPTEVQKMIAEAQLTASTGQTINLAKVATTNSYPDLDNRVTAVSQFENDVPYLTKEQAAEFAKLSDIPKAPTKVGELENDANFITAADIPNQVQADWDTTTSTAKSYIKNKPANVSAFNNDAVYLTEVKAAQTYAASKDLPKIIMNNVTRPLNTNFQPNETRNIDCTYHIDATASVLVGLLGALTKRSVEIFLEVSKDGSTNWEVICSAIHSINMGVAADSTETKVVSGIVPANYFVRIRTAGNGTATYRSGKEIGA